MQKAVPQHRTFLLAGVIGAVGGGLAVALATRAIPRMASQIMAGMMQTLMTRMGAECGASPQEM